MDGKVVAMLCKARIWEIGRVLALVVAMTPALCMVPSTAMADTTIATDTLSTYAIGTIPVARFTVTLDPGEGTGNPIVYRSEDQAVIPTSWRDAGNCQFYYEDDMSMGFMLYDDYCPDAFAAPTGYLFDKWKGASGSYNKLSSDSTTFTALWKADPDLGKASYSLLPEAYTITNSGYSDIACSLDSLVPGTIVDPDDGAVQVNSITFWMNGGTLSDGNGH